MLPEFFFCSLFPVQQTTSGLATVLSSFFGLATNTLNVRNNNNNHNKARDFRWIPVSCTFWIMLKIYLHHGPLCSRFNVVTSSSQPMQQYIITTIDIYIMVLSVLVSMTSSSQPMQQYIITTMFDVVLFCFRCFSGVPT